MNFKEQVAVITGAASGIGRAVAKKLLSSEAYVILLDINKEALQKEFGGSPYAIKIPMKRCGTLEEAVDLITYIISPANSFTTGFTFDL